MPRQWYNIIADMPNPPAPPLHPATREPLEPDDLAPLFPMALIEQEVSQERWIDIPEEVLEIYRLWRPTPLYRARRLEQALGTPAKIYYKYEGVSPAGSHKPNTAVAQAYYNKKEGVKRLATETGAGQWGSALSLACSLFGLECTVYMVKVSYEQKPYRRSLMQVWGAEVIACPSDRTEAGRKILADDPDSPGSLGIAISEAVEDAADPRRHEVRPGQRAQPRAAAPDRHRPGGQEAAGAGRATTPTSSSAACGGGSNFGGLAFPFLRRQVRRARRCGPSPWSRRPAPRSPGATTPTTSATRRS